MKKSINFFKLGLIFLLLHTLVIKTYAQKIVPQAKNKDYFVPKGWKIYEFAVGDLNNDNLEDYCGIIENRNNSSHPLRTIFIAFRTKNNDLVLQSKSESLIPVDQSFNISSEISISNDVLIINTDWLGKGGRTEWKYVFKYKSKNFKLIGAEYMSGNAEEIIVYDYNLVTGSLLIRETHDKEPTKNRNMEIKRKMKNLPEFQSFKYEGLKLKVEDENLIF